jgi:protein-disulfide isomerase
MNRGPAARWRAIALLAAIVGAGASAYLLVEYVTGQPGVCITGSGCDLVRASAFAYPLGIPLPLFGLVFYLVAAALVLRTIDGGPILGIPAVRAVQLVAAAGAVASLALTAIEAFVILAFCTWCLVQAAAAFVLFGASLLLSGERPAEAERRSSRARHQAERALADDRARLQRTGLLGGGATALGVAALLVLGAIGRVPAGTDGQSLAPAGAPRLGSGLVEVVEFADFQCPGCAVLAPILQQMAEADEMTLVARYFPLDSIHPNADASARAAAASQLQDAYWQMSEALYASQAAWKDLDAAGADAYFTSLAEQLDLDLETWRADYESTLVEDTIDADRQAARDLSLNSTPTVFIGGKLYQGGLSLDALRAAIAAAASS